MFALRTSLLASVLLAALCAPVPSHSSDAAQAREGAHGFDFLFGDWRVHHRIKRPTGEWYEFEGTCTTRPQSSSTDGGKTWEPNWVMTFKRM
jgi:hypothetical protein